MIERVAHQRMRVKEGYANILLCPLIQGGRMKGVADRLQRNHDDLGRLGVNQILAGLLIYEEFAEKSCETILHSGNRVFHSASRRKGGFGWQFAREFHIQRLLLVARGHLFNLIGTEFIIGFRIVALVFQKLQKS